MVSNLVSTQKMANFVCCNSTKLDPLRGPVGYAGIVYTSRYTHGGLSFACEALFVCFARNYDYGCVADEVSEFCNQAYVIKHLNLQ